MPFANKGEAAVENPQTARVLVVDDMDMILFVIKDQLLRYGLQVDTAASGIEAVEKAKHNVYDLVFMDHLMPKMDGIQAAKEIRKLKAEYEKLPIIALTSNIDSQAEKMFLASGLNGFLSKPVVKQKLEETLKKWLPRAAQP
jgi:CheY-like chemotaxis protein